MFRLDKKVYKCDLLSITKDIRVNVDRPKKENLLHAETQVVEQVLVEPTFNESCFREIATKKIIPAFRIFNREDYFENYGGVTEIMVPKTACFIKYSEEEAFGDYKGNTLVVATADEVKAYLEQHLSPEGNYMDFEEKLDWYFEKAEAYYDEAKAKGVLSDRKTIKNMIRARRKK